MGNLVKVARTWEENLGFLIPGPLLSRGMNLTGHIAQ